MLEKEIINVQKMTMPELRKCFQSYFGWDCKARNKAFLISRIIYQMQELQYGGLSNATRYLLSSLEIPKPKVELSAGMILERKYKNKQYRIEVCHDYFMMNGERYETLSSVATAITGQKISGNRFFNLELGGVK